MSAVRRRAEDMALVESPGRVAVLNLSRLDQPPVVLSGTAVDVWQAVDGLRDDDAICTHVAATYEMQPAEIGADVLACLSQLTDLGLLQQGDDGG